MKKIVVASFFAFLTVSAFCQKLTDTRNLESFSAISVSGGCSKLILVPGDKESVRIEAEDTDLDKIKTVANGNTLSISMDKGDAAKVTLVVTYRTLTRINNSSNANIETNGVIKSDKFAFNSSGSGGFKAEMDVKALAIAISGGSDIILKGEADEQKYAISGKGDIDAAKCYGKSASVSCSGSGDVVLNISGDVKKAISGTATVSNRHRSN